MNAPEIELGLNPGDEIVVGSDAPPKEDSSSESGSGGGSPKGSFTFLFEVIVRDSNHLVIPYAVACDYIKSSSDCHLRALPDRLHLTDMEKTFRPHPSVMTFYCFDKEGVFLVARGWDEYKKYFNIRPGDKIRFFRTEQVDKNYFFTQNITRAESAPPLQIENVEFPPDGYLFEKSIPESDLVDERLNDRLEISIKDGRTYFPGMEGCEKSTHQIVKLTDYRKKDWYLTMSYWPTNRQFTVMNGWRGFMIEHRLRAGDLVRFYKPVTPSHDKHFLIECV